MTHHQSLCESSKAVTEPILMHRYGKPPIRELRFQRPVKFEAGEVVIDVSGESRVVCSQWSDPFTVQGQEDCLMLNVYVPGQP